MCNITVSSSYTSDQTSISPSFGIWRTTQLHKITTSTECFSSTNRTIIIIKKTSTQNQVYKTCPNPSSSLISCSLALHSRSLVMSVGIFTFHSLPQRLSFPNSHVTNFTHKLNHQEYEETHRP